MSKSVLVIDTPEKGCISCLIGQDHSNMLETCISCPITSRCTIDKETETIPSWCPLKPLPEKIEMSAGFTYWNGMADGWDACINAITGES